MTNHNVWVTTRTDGKWEIREEGADTPLQIVPTQEEAINLGREYAQRNRSELIIQDQEGKIRERMTYGSDPRSVEG